MMTKGFSIWFSIEESTAEEDMIEVSISWLTFIWSPHMEILSRCDHTREDILSMLIM